MAALALMFGVVLAACGTTTESADVVAEASDVPVVVADGPLIQMWLPDGWETVSESMTESEQTGHYRGDGRTLRLRAVPTSSGEGLADLLEQPRAEVVDIRGSGDGLLAERSFGDGSHRQVFVGFEEAGWFYEITSWDVDPAVMIEFARGFGPVASG